MSTVKKKKKKKKTASGPPAWVLPVFGGGGALIVVLLVVVFFGKSIRDRMVGFNADTLRAVPNDADLVLIIRPKGMSGSSGFGAADILQGGGGHLAPTPPKGFGYEKGHVEEAWEVHKGSSIFHVLRFVWKARPERDVVIAASHRGSTIYDCKGRFAVPVGSDMLVFASKDDAFAGVDRMLDSKGPPSFTPKEAKTPSAYFSTGEGTLQESINEGRGPKLPKPKYTYAEMKFIDSDYHVNYTFDYGTAEAAAAANQALEESRKAIHKERKEFMEKNANTLRVGEDPYASWDRLSNIPVSVEGNQLKFKLSFWKMTQAAGQPLVSRCFGMGGGGGEADEEEEGKGKLGGVNIPGA